ncbi:MAG: DsbA family protein [Elusimicrobia bacterium]|nr:DsbA family protein [Elusimicrobiota bacterium]
MTRHVRLAAAAAAVWFAAMSVASAAEVDKKALYRHLKKVFSAPPGVEFELKDLKPSSLPGFQSGKVEIRFKSRVQTQPIQISNDGRYYVMSEALTLGESKVPGLISTPESDTDGPQIHITKDAKMLIIGEVRDLSVDPDAANLSKINIKNSPKLGKAGAPLMFVEFSDLQCPFCASAHQALDKELVKAYGDKIVWVYKHFPLTNIHPWAYSAAVATSCAYKQKPDSVWKVTAGFYEKQEETNPGNIKERAMTLAKASGLDAKKFETCFDKQESKDQVEADIAEAKALGVNSTPTFYINGRQASGFRDFSTLKETLDDMLAEKTGKAEDKGK